MGIDFNDGRLANQWNPRGLIIELNNKKEIIRRAKPSRIYDGE